MDYKTKIKYGEELAENLLNGKNLEELKKGLLNGGLYEKDVQNVVSTSLNILKEKIGPTIQNHLLNNSIEAGVKEFQQIDGEVMKDIIKEQATALGKQQRNAVAKMIREKKSHTDIHTAVDNRFYPKEMVNHQLQISQQVKEANSGGSRIINLGIGGILCAAGIGSYFTGVFWYGLIIVGGGFLFKGLMTVDNPYEE